MPTYEFKCPEGHTFDHFFRSISAAQATLPCPTCGRPADRQVSGGAGLVFKGSGFYITDYGKDGKKPQTAPSSGEKSETSGSDAKTAPDAKTTPDSKSAASAPAAKPESKPAPKPKSDE